MIRTSLMLGAGASCPFEYPTTQQFFDILVGMGHDKYQEKLLKVIKATPRVKDVEHVLQMIDALIHANSDPLANALLSSVVHEIRLPELPALNWGKFGVELEKLKERIIDLLYYEYHFKQSTKYVAFAAFEKLLSVLNSPEIATITKNIFILNYDRLVEEFLLSKQIKFIDGFSENNSLRRVWTPSLFKPSGELPTPKTPIYLFKLHGSLDWRERTDGTIECVTTEEPSRSTYYKRNIFIYPTEYCDATREPYQTLYKNFRQLKERADALVIIGYSFRDDHINDVILDFLNFNKERMVFAISPTIDEDAKILFSQVTGTGTSIAHDRFIQIKGKFPDAKTLDELGTQLFSFDMTKE